MPGVSHSSISGNRHRHIFSLITSLHIMTGKRLLKQTNFLLKLRLVKSSGTWFIKKCSRSYSTVSTKETFFSFPLIPSAYYNNYHNERKQWYGMHTLVCVYVCVLCLAVLGDRQRDDEAPGPLQTTHLINDCIHQHTSPTPCSPVYLFCSDLTRSVSLRSDVCIRSHVEKDGCRLHSERRLCTRWFWV